VTRVVEDAFNIRKLAAIDIALLGFKLAFAEYACGVLLSLALGVFALFRSHSPWQLALAVYLICLGINYVPMLAHTVSIASRQNAQAELAEELTEKRKAMSKYRRVSLLLLVPLLVPILMVTGERPRRRRT
jgi:hypothetical protein